MWSIILLTIVGGWSTTSQAQVQVFPTRITLTDQRPSSYLNLQNSSSASETYHLELVEFPPKPDGQFAAPRPPGADHPLKDRIKFSPALASLAPGEKQVVRLMSLQASELKTGEYVLYLRAAPEGERNDGEKAPGFHLNAKIAVAVPVIVRRGDVKVEPTITQATYETHDNQTHFHFELHKTGNGFAHGDLEILARKKDATEPVSVATVRGLSSYLDSRRVEQTVSEKETSSAVGGEVAEWLYTFKSNSDSASPFSLEGKFAAKASEKKINKRPSR